MSRYYVQTGKYPTVTRNSKPPLGAHYYQSCRATTYDPTRTMSPGKQVACSRWCCEQQLLWICGFEEMLVLQGRFPEWQHHCSHTGVCQQRTSIFLYPSVCVEDRNNQSHLLQAETTLRYSSCMLVALPGQPWGNKPSLHPPLQL